MQNIKQKSSKTSVDKSINKDESTLLSAVPRIDWNGLWNKDSQKTVKAWMEVCLFYCKSADV
jgi:hypothetical protein